MAFTFSSAVFFNSFITCPNSFFCSFGTFLNSAKKLNETSEDEIYNQSKKRLEEVISQGTGAVEIKSGYGLTVEGELKMLRVIDKLKANYPIEIKATFSLFKRI